MREELVLQRMVVNYQDGSCREINAGDPEGIRHSDIVQTVLRGILRREIELV